MAKSYSFELEINNFMRKVVNYSQLSLNLVDFMTKIRHLV